MNDSQRDTELSRLLDELADSLDIPPSKYADAVSKYETVGNWLEAEGSILSPYSPDIYPQGSFALGTSVRPLDQDEYDVDLVCYLAIRRQDTTQQELKHLVGDRLRAHKTYRDMLEEKTRCWRLNYAGDFHMDILPAIPDESAMSQSDLFASDPDNRILVPDRELVAWKHSNPRGYAAWFSYRMAPIFKQRRIALAESEHLRAEQIPEYRVRTPLQRAVQILKRHRDIRFGDNDDKPISIIITTLAASAYENESELLETLVNIIPRMRSGVQKRHDTWWVENPVNSDENFADKWEGEPRKAMLFFEWLDELEDHYLNLRETSGIDAVGSVLKKSYGHREVKVALEQYGHFFRKEREAGRVHSAAKTGALNVAGSGTVVRNHQFYGS